MTFNRSSKPQPHISSSQLKQSNIGKSQVFGCQTMEKISIDEEEVRVKEIDREYAQWKMETLSAQVEIMANHTKIFQSI